MERIGAVGRPGVGRVEAVRPTAATESPASRALVVLDGGRAQGHASAASPRDGRAEAGFVTQLLVVSDPTLRTSRLVRTRQAAASYAETARRLA